jgi:hypothetical protein
MSDKIARHEPNSASCYFVCSFDSSRNKLYKFEGRDCVINVIEQLRLLGARCVQEQQKNERMIMTDDDENDFKKAKIVLFAAVALQRQTTKSATIATERDTTEEQLATPVILIIFQTVIYRLFFTICGATILT